MARGFSSIVAIIAAAGLVSGSAQAYQISRCAKAAEEAIDNLGIDRSKISEAKTDVQVSGGENMVVTGVNIWLRSDACRGSLVLVLSSSCAFVDTFDRGDCSLAVFKE